MAAKSNPITEIKGHLTDNKLIIGTERVLKNLKTGKLEKIFLSSNCSEKAAADIERYSAMSGCTVEKMKVPNDELGVVCKKQFSISVLGILK
ncbi:MAG: 50S ribosomal protein L30 [bacterium]|nr:50S ribosomal protein L30 [bacterium]